MRKNAVVLGNFDGVHKAHAALISEIVRVAGQKNMDTSAFIFETHPRTILGGFEGNILTNERKKEIISELGIENVIYEKLTPEFLNMEPEAFVRDILVEQLRTGFVGVGYNYSFGRGGAGKAPQLAEYGKKYGFEVYIMPQMLHGEIPISSTSVRRALKTGNMHLVNELCTKPYLICGRVEHGKGRGAGMGIPTANLYFDEGMLVPRNGVYISRTYIGDEAYKSITNIGVNPTVDITTPHSETHILGFSGDVYGKAAKVELCSFLRDEIRFDSIEKLAQRINEDIKCAESSVDIG